MELVPLLVLLLTACCVSESAKILSVFPYPSISHQIVFRKLTLELLRRGHEVTVLTTDPAFPKGKSPSNLTEIDVHDLSYGLYKSFMSSNYTVKDRLSYSELRVLLPFFSNLFAKQIQSPQFQDILKNKRSDFDLLLIESVIRPTFGLTHIFKVPTISVSSLGAMPFSHKIVGSLTHALLYPSFMNKKIYNLTLFDKLDELYTTLLFDLAEYYNEKDDDDLLKDCFGPEIPPLRELYNNVNMLFVNLHPLWADNQPVPSGVIYMGGIHQTETKELSKDLQTYLDSSKHGVIYLSFGTNMLSTMIPKHVVENIVKAFSKMPYDVLWKWDQDELPGKPSNVRISKWLPQADLLRHPNIKLFVTQAGLQSTDEAITAGVPVLAVPMLGDQWYNAEKYVKHGIGEKLLIETLTEEIFKETAEKIIKDDRYKENMVRLRSLMLDQPQPPLERAMWWIEHVLRHGSTKHLRAPTANISWTQYYEIEVVLFIFSVISVLLVLLVTLVRRISQMVKIKKIKTM